MSDTYTPPDSNPDPYSTTTSSPPIDLSSLPRPLPVLGPLTGYTPANVTLGIQKRLAGVSQTISRPLTPDETAALTYHCAKASSIASYGPSLGIATGAYRTWATRKEFRWPFYGKIISDELGTGFWDGEKMRLNGKEILAGVSKEGKANILHTARGMAYVTIALAVVPVFVSSYAAMVAGTSEMRDQRLKSVTKEMMAAVKADRDERVAKIKGQRGQQTTTNPNAMTEQGGEVWKERRERMGGRMEREAEAGDDMSPTGGAMLDYGVDMEQGDSGVMSDSQLQSQPSPLQRRQPSPRSPTPSHPSQSSSSSPSYDDASPTAGRGMLDDTFSSDSTSDSTGVSAWERIRQQTTSGETPPASPSPSSSTRRGSRKTRQQQQDGDGDNFTFSREEEERGYARAEAQREFDERLEKERRGGSFGGNE